MPLQDNFRVLNRPDRAKSKGYGAGRHLCRCVPGRRRVRAFTLIGMTSGDIRPGLDQCEPATPLIPVSAETKEERLPLGYPSTAGLRLRPPDAAGYSPDRSGAVAARGGNPRRGQRTLAGREQVLDNGASGKYLTGPQGPPQRPRPASFRSLRSILQLHSICRRCRWRESWFTTPPLADAAGHNRMGRSRVSKRGSPNRTTLRACVALAAQIPRHRFDPVNLAHSISCRCL
jgi:hypothetical protein